MQTTRQEPARLDVWRDVAEETFNDLVWESETRASIECPGDSTHSKPGKANLFLDHIPTVHCFHDSCRSARETANADLRSECGRRCREAGLADEWTAEERGAWIQRKRDAEARAESLRRLRRRLRAGLPEIVDAYHRSLAEWTMGSPSLAPSERPKDHLRAWLVASQCAFAGRFWIGNTYDSGHKWNIRNFATGCDWMERLQARSSLQWQWQHVCPATFAHWPKLCNRVEPAVVERRLLAVEFDELSTDSTANKECGLAVVRYVLEKYDLRMFSACDSGNKSVHALLSWPKDRATFDAVTFELEALGADPCLWRLASTCRLPGAMRLDDEGIPTGQWQRLYYLDEDALLGGNSSKLTHPEHKPDSTKAFKAVPVMEEGN